MKVGTETAPPVLGTSWLLMASCTAAASPSVLHPSSKAVADDDDAPSPLSSSGSDGKNDGECGIDIVLALANPARLI